MNPDTFTFANARDAADQLLRAVGLDAYLFQVEPDGSDWHLKVECATEDGWQSLEMDVDEAELLASCTDPAAFERLEDRLRARLRACRRAD
ncbi:MAG: hypothetical protein WC012_04145 [Thiohalomonadaceae bacterium]